MTMMPVPQLSSGSQGSLPPQPPTPPDLPAAPSLLPPPDTVKRILGRQDKAVKRILGPVGSQPSVLSPQEQLRRYKARTQDTSWVDQVLPMVKDQNAAWMLQAIKDHGWEGVSSYIQAMQKLGGQGG